MSNQQNGVTPTSRNGATSTSSGLLDTTPNALNFVRDNAPNAGKLINSLRHLGYDNYAAIKDLCDNCTDAHADNVAIWINSAKAKGGVIITIADDGDGMDEATLDQALRLGSETPRNEVSDLGKFGMGLVTASLSICRRVEVITKQKDGPMLYSVQDVDVVVETNEFVKHIGLAGPEQIAQFEDCLGDAEHGTIILLSKCDQLQNKNQTNFANKVKKELGQTFRRFIQSGLEMWVNDEPVAAIDPMMKDDGAVEYSTEIYPFEFTDEDGLLHKEKIEVRLYMLPDFGIEGNRDRAINIPNQGFYLLRNYREIADGDSLDLFTKHNDFNRFRGEILVSGTLDDVMGVDFTKQKPKFNQAFRDRLLQELKPQINGIRKQLKSQRIAVEDKENEIYHSEAARQIGQKAHLLAKPRLETEKREPSTTEPKTKGPELGGTKERVNAARTQKKEVALPCRFETASMGQGGAIWEAEPRGKTLIITWNVDHPFYQRFILENPSMVTATDFLVYSLAAAEIMFTGDDDEETQQKRQDMMNNIRTTLSSNMRQLLS
ncbi:ATP-binding protein [bacterium]|nr:MAG: ATP-binding protein [bacterium]